MKSTDNFNFLDIVIAYFRFRKLKKYVNVNDTLLDFGCGYQAFFLKNIASGIKLGIGVDAHIQPQKIGKNVSLLKYKFKNHLPFNNRYFDKVFMLAVLEHIELSKIDALFKEVNRVLKPKGTLVLTTPTTKSKDILEFLAFKVGIISKDEVGDHKKYYKRSDVESICETTGFRIVRYENFMLGMNSFYVLKKLVQYDKTYQEL